MAKAMKTFEMDECNRKALERLEPRMQALVAKVAHESPSARRVRSAQRAWRTYVDKQCLVVASQFLGGSQERVQYGTCKVYETKKRIRGLRAHLNSWREWPP